MSKKSLSWKLEYFLLSIVLILSFILRLYKINSPLADWHSWRQADSAAVIRNLATEGFDPFRPRRDNLIPTSAKNLPNPHRYFFEDFPLAYDVYPALLYKVFGVKEKFARLTSVTFSLGAIVSLFLLVKLMINFRVAILSVLFFSILPFSIYYSRTVMQEPALVFYLVTAVYFLARWLIGKKGDKKQQFFFLASALLYALSLLTKVYSLFFLPLFVYLFWQKDGLKIIKKNYFYGYFIIAFFPFVIWWLWLLQHPEGLPYSTWLLNEGNIRFKGAWFYWLFAERVGKIILGYWGLALFTLGLVVRSKTEKHFFHLWFLCVVLFFVVFAKGNVTHDYYQYLFLPVASVFLAKGSYFLLTAPKQILNKFLCCLLFVVCTLFMLAFSWYFVRSFYDIKGGVDLAGVAVNKLTPKESLVVAGDGADPTLLYNTHRIGWAVGFGSLLENSAETINELKKQGADFYVTTKVGELKNSDFGRFMYQNFSVVEETNQFVLFNLRSR